MIKNMPVIAIEEHYYDQELASHIPKTGSPAIVEKMFDLGKIRIDAMDKAGVDVAVLSHGAPAGQGLVVDGAVDIIKRVNDRLAEVCARSNGRFKAFAVLPTIDPDASARELERCVKELGFLGAMIHGPTKGRFMDDKACWGVFERAQALDVPIYLHPASPMRQIVDAYYADYMKAFPSILSAGWGFTVETATVAIRLILSGMFQKYPRTKIVLGHLGEGLPFLLWRIDQALSRPGQEGVKFRETFCNNFWVTTSGFFSTPALMCCMQELGMDRIIFSIDWPYVENDLGTDWLKTLQLNPQDMNKLLHGNAKALLKI
ncbi:MAG: amidohydrolase [Alphaproteobacteria bacterium]|nr:amidohydrolase [Alphaproteobacteria bacterium]